MGAQAARGAGRGAAARSAAERPRGGGLGKEASGACKAAERCIFDIEKVRHAPQRKLKHARRAHASVRPAAVTHAELCALPSKRGSVTRTPHSRQKPRLPKRRITYRTMGKH